MENNKFSTETADINVTGMRFSEIANIVKAEPGGEEIVVNEQDQNEAVNQDEDTVNGSD